MTDLPPDLLAMLRDHSIIVPQDQAVFERISEWKDAPTGTAAPLTADEWEKAWSVTVQKMLDERARALAAEAVVVGLREQLPSPARLRELAALNRRGWFACDVELEEWADAIDAALLVSPHTEEPNE